LAHYKPMKQQTLSMAADNKFENYRKPTQRDDFLKTMDAHLSVLSACCAFIA
jgi:IS5 family transposase